MQFFSEQDCFEIAFEIAFIDLKKKGPSNIVSKAIFVLKKISKSCNFGHIQHTNTVTVQTGQINTNTR